MVETPDANYQKLESQETEQKIDIPDNKLAKLMYYLKCVFTIIEADTEKRYTNYKNYYLLSKLEEQSVLGLVSTFNPTLMLELNLFKIEPDFVPIGKENEFYDISDEKFESKIQSEVTIAEVHRKILKVMICKQSWINKYYEEPLKEYENPTKTEEKKEEKKETKKSNYSHSNRHLYYREHEKECHCCACTCGCCCECDCDGECERNCCCCGYKCPYISCCGNNICPDQCSCYCFRESMAVVFWVIVFAGCAFYWIMCCISSCCP